MKGFSVRYLVNWKHFWEHCARRGCHSSALRNHLVGRGSGIRIGQDWYCSADCFQQGAEARIRQLQDTASREMPRRQERLPLGLLLLSRGCITRDQLELALQQQRAYGGPLGNILCDLNFANEQQIAAAAATQWGCPVFSPKSSLSEIRARIPYALMNLYSMVPVHYAEAMNKLLIGFVHGIEHHVLHTIEQITSCVTVPCLITASECRESMRTLARQNNDVTFDRISSATEIASIVQSYACQVGAKEARLEMCRDYIWARLNREEHSTDLLFSLSRELTWEREHWRN